MPPIQLLKEIAEQFAMGNMTFAEPYLADGIRWNILGSSTVAGKAEVLEANRMAQLESFPVITIRTVVGEGDVVVVESTGKARTKSGKPYDQAYCEVFRFRNGQLQEVTTYLDTAVSIEALS